MYVKHLLAIPAAVLAAATLTSCGGGGEETGSAGGARTDVVLNIAGDPRTLDPGLATDTISSRALMPFIRGLTIQDETGAAQPEIASNWTASGDNTVFDFELREALWSTGKPVTAEDFKYAWLDRVLNPEFGAEYAYLLYYIKGAREFYEGATRDRSAVGVESDNPRHLRVRLVSPAPFFPELVAHQTFYPVPAGIDEKSPNWAVRAETHVANGPFRLVEYESGNRLVGVRRADYWNAAAVGMEKLTFRLIQEESTELIAFESGELDGTYLVPRPELERLKGNPALRNPGQVGTYFLNFNMQHEAFADPQVRRALTIVLDRDAIVRNVTRAGERVALSFVPQDLYMGKPKTYFADAQVAEAKRLMAKAGYPDGKGFPKIRYIYNTMEMHRQIAQVIQENWRSNLGIEMTIENQEFKTLIDNRRAGDFDICRNGWIADFSDPINFLEIYLSDSGNNDSHWKDAEYDRLVERARVEADPALRDQYLREAEDYFMNVLPIIPIFHYAHPYLCDPDLLGYEWSPMMTIDVAKLRWRK